MSGGEGAEKGSHKPFQRRDKYEGYDFHRDEEMQYNASGKYSTHLYGEEAVRLIREREQQEDTDRKPFFLYLPFQALHAPMQVNQNIFGYRASPFRCPAST